MAFGERQVFDGLSFSFPPGRIAVILGGSGSGKSTALRLIGGLIQPLSGRIFVDGEDITRLSERQMYSVRAKLGMVFQGGALLDWMSVFDNLAFPLRERTKLSEAEIAARVRETLGAVGLGDADDLSRHSQAAGSSARLGARPSSHALSSCSAERSPCSTDLGTPHRALLVGSTNLFGITSWWSRTTFRRPCQAARAGAVADGAVQGTRPSCRQQDRGSRRSSIRSDAAARRGWTGRGPASRRWQHAW